MRLPALAAALTAGLAAVPTASAHVQVTPTKAAPDDAVRFEFIVPNERSQRTVEVALKIPSGVLPFSFQSTPGWTRSLEKGSDGSIRVVRWKGRMDSDGFAVFSFLASTPPTEGEAIWKTVQTYSDGGQSAWIGPSDSDNPAPVTEITASTPKRNAGGENGASAEGTGSAATAPVESAPSTDDGGVGAEAIALVLGGGALLLAGAALFVSIRRRPPT